MRTFRFFAKQGQHSQVALLLLAMLGVKAKLSPRPEGVFITVPIPAGVSRRSIDRMLHRNNVPGSVSRCNKLLVIRSDHGGWVDHWKVRTKVGYNQPFMLFDRSKNQFVKSKLVFNDPGCDCCGGWDSIEKV